jgi:hypothetical protein
MVQIIMVAGLPFNGCVICLNNRNDRRALEKQLFCCACVPVCGCQYSVTEAQAH